MSMIPTDVDRWERDSARLEAGGWLGKGDPPSRQAAIVWAVRQGVPRAVAEQRIVGGSKKALGTSARIVVREEGAAARRRNRQSGGSTPTADVDGDGTITAADVEAVGDDDALADEIFGDMPAPGAAEDTRGAPLWPYDTSGMSDAELAELTVENRSKGTAKSSHWGSKYGGERSFQRPSRTGARYYAADALSPLRWSAEQRADLQRVMHSMGLYGDKSIRLGTWTADDQDVFTAVLEYSNVEGTRWHETLSGWRKVGLPPELQERIKSAQPKKPTIQVTNPLDIRQAAQNVSLELTGEVDRGFSEGAVGGYQSMEVAAQSGVYGDQDAGGGGTVTAAPSMGAFMEDKLRREQPIEVDGYQFVGQFQNFLSMLGV